MSARSPRIRVAAILPQGDSLLLVQHAKNGKRYWMLPGGGLDYGETFEACAIREIKEETGLDIEIERMLFLSEAIDPKGSRHVVNVYLLGRIQGGTLAVPEGDVIEMADFIPVADLERIVLYPAIAPILMAAHASRYADPIRNLGSMWVD